MSIRMNERMKKYIVVVNDNCNLGESLFIYIPAYTLLRAPNEYRPSRKSVNLAVTL